MTTIPRPLMSRLLKDQPVGRLMAVAICGLGTLSVAQVPAYAQSDDTNDFWTRFVPSTDTRLIFVSNSEGSDNNSGTSPEQPVKSLDRAYELLRDGYPDWMLLKRGDTWYESLPRWSKSGRDVDEKLVVGAYGESSDRPQIRPDGGNNGINGFGDDTVNHVAFVGFHLEPNSRTSDQGGKGISWLKDAEDILFEDLYIDGFKDNMTLQAHGEGVSLREFRVNGCVVVDAWSNGSHSQGLFASGVDGLVIENSVFDHNGWNLDMGAQPTIFNHNIYIQNSSDNVIFRNSISSDASSHGIQMRPGGTMQGNLFISNPLAMQLGGGSSPNPGGVVGLVENNAVLYGRDINENSPRGFGLNVSNIREANIFSNYFHISTAGSNHYPLSFGGEDVMLKNIDVSNNIILGWHGAVRLLGPDDSTAVVENISIANNRIFRDLTSGGPGEDYDMPFMRIFDSWDDDVIIRDNSYHYHGLHDKPFKVGQSTLSINSWQNQIEPTANFVEESSPPPSIGLDLYLASIGDSGGWQDFVRQARSLSRSSSNNDAFMAPSVIDWFTNRLTQHDLLPTQ